MKFYRVKDIEDKHRYYRYYTVNGSYYEPFCRAHSVCVFKTFKTDNGWCLWLFDNVGGNKWYFKKRSEAQDYAQKYFRAQDYEKHQKYFDNIY